MHTERLTDPQYESLPAVPRFAAADGRPAEPLSISSQALLQGRREVRIRHGDRVYRLCLTRSDGLILVK